MQKIGIIGLGNMGMGMAANLIKQGYEVTGFDLQPDRLNAFVKLGGDPAKNILEVGRSAESVFVMVLNGRQVWEVVCGNGGLLEGLSMNDSIIVTATIHPSEIIVLEPPAKEKNINLIDCPVSGGKQGSDNGTLTLMAAAALNALEKNREVLQAIGKNIFHVGEEIGLGQKVKASMQALIGSTFTAIFESLVLGVKAGINAKVLHEVIGSSGVGSPLFNTTVKLIMNREFKNTGSHIDTMYKDLGISMNLAKENGVPMFTTAAAYELFRAGKSLFPDEDNWCIVKLLEQIAGTEVKMI